ncbi:hypothetical protein HHK36_009338 [Tetracentron sinense]|uniref:Uncharacterized protein n=1 Tax=Tetracentron sinense TaxID=13715 RepID=A0A834ZG29_TETSI|nr:hypothetical protein HHK36_009338 [Tetracentron sinense]
MWELKVANQRDSGEYVRFPARGDEREGPSQSQSQSPAPQEDVTSISVASMFYGYSGGSEMSEMVSALSRVVSGNHERSSGSLASTTTPFVYGNSSASAWPSLSYSSSSSSPGGGQKRVRGEESGGQLSESESLLKAYRGFAEFTASQGESSGAGVTGHRKTKVRVVGQVFRRLRGQIPVIIHLLLLLVCID